MATGGAPLVPLGHNTALGPRRQSLTSGDGRTSGGERGSGLTFEGLESGGLMSQTIREDQVICPTNLYYKLELLLLTSRMIIA